MTLIKPEMRNMKLVEARQNISGHKKSRIGTQKPRQNRIWPRVVIFLLLLGAQAQLRAHADSNREGSSTDSSTDSSLDSASLPLTLEIEEANLRKPSASVISANQTSPLYLPGSVVSGFDSHSCGDLDYQGMSVGAPASRLMATSPTTPPQAPAQASAPLQGPQDPCAFFLPSRVYVNSRTHRLYLCDSGRTQKSYNIAIGQAGRDKHQEGDNRTPLGTYPLTPARLSDQFGLFILVGYPTPAQIDAGYTGDSIGIHGPRRGTQCNGVGNVNADWTEGCVAVANDVFIEEIADFLLKHPGVQATIR